MNFTHNKLRFLFISASILVLLLISIEYIGFVSRLNNEKSHNVSYSKHTWCNVDQNRIAVFTWPLFKAYFAYEWLDFKIYFDQKKSTIFSNHFKQRDANKTRALNLFIEKQVYNTFQNDQRIRKQIARFKSPVIHKKKYKAIYVNDSGDTSKVQLKNIGMNHDHYIGCNDHDSFSSFKIKFGKHNNEYGKKATKSILRPHTRGSGLDMLANELYFQIAEGIKINSERIELIVNGRSRGEFIMEDAFDKFLLEANGRRDGNIFEVGFNGPLRHHELDAYEPDFSNYNNIPGDTTLSNIFIKSINDGIIPDSLIDKHKFEAVILLCYDFFGEHPLIDINLHWYHNPVNNLFEPTIREVQLNPIKNRIIQKENGGITISRNDQYTSEDGSIVYNYVKQNKLDFELLRQKYYPLVNIEALKKIIQSYPNIEDEINIICQVIEKYATHHQHKQEPSVSQNVIWDSQVELNTNFNIASGQTLVIKNGACINFGPDATLNIEGNWICDNDQIVKFNGTKRNSIFVKNSKLCSLKNLHFQNFENLSDTIRHHFLPSAITFYQCNVNLINCSFQSNTNGDDYLNFFRCKNVRVSSCSFYNVLADAIDSDFSTLVVENSYFDNIGNDAIDVSGSNLEVTDSKFFGVLDKVFSAGEASVVDIKKCSIQNSALGIVSKDGSYVIFDSCYFQKNTLDVTAFQKKLEYPAAHIYGYNSTIFSSLIEEGVKSNLDISKENDVIQLMYGKKYGRETKK